MRADLWSLIRLAVPIALTRIGVVLLVMIDIAVVGRFAVDELAYHALASTVSGTVFLVGMGLIHGASVYLAQAYGRGEAGIASSVAQDSFREMGRIWRYGLLLAVVYGLLCILPSLFAEQILLFTRQEPEIAAGAAPVWVILALPSAFAIMFVVTSSFLECLGRPMAPVWITAVALVVNVGLNVLFVGGWGPIPAMGAVGSAWATFLLKLLMLFALVVFFLRTTDRIKFGLDNWRIGLPPDFRARVRRLGYSNGVSHGIESSGFSGLVIMAGWLGATVLGAFNIAFNFLALIFMISLGIGVATGVLVGNAVGAQDIDRARRLGFLAWALNAATMLVLGTLIALFSVQIATVFTPEPSYVAIAAPLIVLCGFVHIVDGGQAIFAFATRSTGDGWFPTGLHVISYIGIMLPTAYLFSQPLGRGEGGLIGAIIVASVVSCALLAVRFWWRTRPIA